MFNLLRNGQACFPQRPHHLMFLPATRMRAPISPRPHQHLGAVFQLQLRLSITLWSSYQGLLVHSQQAGAWRTQGSPEARAAVGRTSSPTGWVCGVRACRPPSWAPPVMPLLASTASRATGSGTTAPGPWLRPWPPTGSSVCFSEWRAGWQGRFLSSSPPRGPLCFPHRGVDGTRPGGLLSHLQGPWET